MRFKIVLLAAVLLCGMQAAAEETYRLMIFGDSLSAGYRLPKKDSFPAQLQAALKQKGYTQIKVINNSKSRETTAGGLKRQPSALKKRPDGVLLELGINDVIQEVPFEKITKNLSLLIENFQQEKVSVLLAGMKLPPFVKPAYVAGFSQMYVDLSRKYKLLCYPFFMQGIFEAAGNQISKTAPFMLADGVHPNAEGVRLTVEHIMPSIQKFLAEQNVYPQKQ